MNSFNYPLDGIRIEEYKMYDFTSDVDGIFFKKDMVLQLKPKLYWWLMWEIMDFKEVLKRCRTIIVFERSLKFDWPGLIPMAVQYDHDEICKRASPETITFKNIEDYFKSKS